MPAASGKTGPSAPVATGQKRKKRKLWYPAGKFTKTPNIAQSGTRVPRRFRSL